MRKASILTVLALCLSAAAISPAASQEPARGVLKFGVVPYASVNDALTAIKSRPGIEVKNLPNMLEFSTDGDFTVWSFTTPGHPAHPSAVSREVESSKVATLSVRCEAAQARCDAFLAETVAQMNAQGFD